MLFFDNEDKNTNFFPHRRITERAKRMFFCAISYVIAQGLLQIFACNAYVISLICYIFEWDDRMKNRQIISKMERDKAFIL
ncbi:hypothetical protein HR15_08890 [Porphyromonas gulae]|uniref:Uncharacterized protein n=1 Tax=Porphyromonas gulae TaxID=111105 RepID=A0A0A2FBN5_9PORP|nr:hypothetical protein HR15_08890 [Porphyromonas gulae]KGN87465.1 hypothetical protein HR08_02030 [Porphyromonas gulae]